LKTSLIRRKHECARCQVSWCVLYRQKSDRYSTLPQRRLKHETTRAHQQLLGTRMHYSQGVRFEERSHAHSVHCWACFLTIDKPGKRTLCDDVSACPVSRTSAMLSDWSQNEDSSAPIRRCEVLVLRHDISSGQSPRRNATAACSRCCPSPSCRSLHSACV
jgi:hypothetical protein